MKDKPSLLALANPVEMRASLQRIAQMSDVDKDKYTERFMQAYADPLREAGFEKGSLGYEIAQTILGALNLAIFDRCY